MIPAHILKQPGGVVESRLPEGAMQATLRAYSSVIKGASDIGGQFVQFAEEQQDMRNKHDLLEGELSIKDAAADARARMMEEPDASKWTGIYEKRMKEAGDMLRGKGYAPVVHERLSEAYTRTLGTGKIQVASEALKENRRSAQAMGMVAIEKARQSSSWDEADAQAEELHRQGLLDEADVEKVKMANDGYREAERHQMELEADPVAYLDRLRKHSENYPKLSKIKAAKMLERAERAVAQGKAAELDMLEEGVKAGRIDEMLDVPVHELKYMDVKDLEAFEKGLRRSTPPTDEEYSVAAQMIDNLEGMRKDGTEEAELAKAASDVDRYLSAIGPKGDVKWLRERLNDVNPNRAAKAEATAKYNEAQKRAWKEATALTKDHFARGTFGEVTDDEELPVIETGVKRRAMEDKMRAWIESEENPTPEQVKQKMGRLLGAEDEKDLVKKRLETSPLSKPKARRYGQNLENLLNKYGEKQTTDTSGVMEGEPLGARHVGDPSASGVKDFVKGFEGWNPNAYDDYGQKSIGYGTRAKAGETAISKEEAEKRLEEELGMHRIRVIEHAKKHGYNLKPHQIDALTSFDYNTGALNQLTANGSRSLDEIADKMPLYKNADGKTLRGLERRREAERRLFLSGYEA